MPTLEHYFTDVQYRPYWPNIYYSFTIHAMDKIEQQILGNLTLHPEGLGAQDLQTVIRPKVSQPTLWRRIDRLRAIGRIRAIGRGRATRYVNHESDHTISDLRSKMLHIEVGRRLIRRPSLVDGARQRLQRMYQSAPYSKNYLDRWAELLAGPLENVLQVLGAEDEESKALRHVSPFAGILSENERLKILRKQGLIR
ncbi:MAG: hypothetical protein DRR42_01755 [Gammaproteobacteria bacterium]|nr:MAG: hypothetical protein DRR42_01755 [Gammaproteobacteria bacterium]